MKNTKEELEKSISFLQHRLKKFTDEELSTEAGNEAYNKLLIKKAVMVKELQNSNGNKFKNFVKKLQRKVSGKKLICDNF